MRFSDVKVKHIYNVIFDDVRECEFDRKHLAVVLKKNNDMKTCIVMPLTTEKNGDGTNKFKVGELKCLPASLREVETYAVFNQIRTLNVSRFIALKDGDSRINCKIDNELFFTLLSKGFNDITFDLSFDEKINFFRKEYEQACIAKAIDMAYTILKINRKIDSLQGNCCEEEYSKINELNEKILDILSNRFEYTLTKKQIDDGINNIFDDIVNHKCIVD